MAIDGSPPNAHGPQKDGGKGAAGRHAFIAEIARGYLGVLWLAREPGATSSEGARFVRHVAPLAAAGTRAAILEAARWDLAPGAELIEGRTSLDVVMPFMQGDVLRSLLRAETLKHAADPRILVGVVERVLQKLQALHERAEKDRSPHGYGGAHPDSVVVDIHGEVHLIEGGIGAVASAREPWRSDPQRLGYMAPEQTQLRPTADARTDVFSMGVVLWEGLANRRLFPGSDAKVVRERVQKGPIAHLGGTRASGAAGIATPIADVVARALERDPAARFPSAAAMADALSAAATANPSEIGAWVAGLAETALAKRAQFLERASLPPGSRSSLVPPAPGARASVSPPRPSATAPPSTEPDSPPTDPSGAPAPDEAVPEPTPGVVAEPAEPAPSEVATAEVAATNAEPETTAGPIVSALPDTEPSATEAAEGKPARAAETTSDTKVAEVPLRSVPVAGEIDVSDLPEEPDDTLMSAQPIPGAPPSSMPLRPLSARPPMPLSSMPPPLPHLDSLPAPMGPVSPGIGAPSQFALLTAAPETPLERRKVAMMLAGVGLIGIGAGFFLAHLGRDGETRAEAALPPVLITAPSSPAEAEAAPSAAAPEPSAVPAAPSASAPSAVPAAPSPSAPALEVPAASAAPPSPAGAPELEPTGAATGKVDEASASAPAGSKEERPARERGEPGSSSGKAPRSPGGPSGTGFKPGGI